MFKATQLEIKKAINSMNYITRKTSIPVLKNVVLKTQHNVITLESTNLESFIIYEISGTITQCNKGVMVDGATFRKLILNAASKHITVELIEGDSPMISINGIRIPVVTNIDDFPAHDADMTELTFVHIDNFISATRSVWPYGTDSKSPYCKVVQFHTEGNRLTITSTDNVAVMQAMFEIGENTLSSKFNVSKAEMVFLHKIMTSSWACVAETTKYCVIATDKFTYVTRLIDCIFPELNGALSLDGYREQYLSSGITSTVSELLPLCNKGEGLLFHFGDDAITIEYEDNQREFKTVCGLGVSILLDGKLFNEIISKFKCTDVLIALKDSTHLMNFRHDHLRAYLMPMKMNEADS
ncbi:MAG: hypothetical protein HQK77_15320 [Desulfobacterales bacterium]|nr:hypothetical protein [Desulfobacterales bacterium]